MRRRNKRDELAISQASFPPGLGLDGASRPLRRDGAGPGYERGRGFIPGGCGPRSDSQIEMDVVHALDAALSQALKNDLITAATIQSEVTLSGTVSSKSSRKLAVVACQPGAGRDQGAEQFAGWQSPGCGQRQRFRRSADGRQPAGGECGAACSRSAAEFSKRAIQPRKRSNGPRKYPPPPVILSRLSPSRLSPAIPRPSSLRGLPPPPSAQQPQYGPAASASGLRESQGAGDRAARSAAPVADQRAVGSKRAKAGTPVEFLVLQDVPVGGVLAIPRGATVHGVVTEAKKAGALGGSPELALQFTRLDLGGEAIELDSSQFKVKGRTRLQHGWPCLGRRNSGALIAAAWIVASVRRSAPEQARSRAQRLQRLTPDRGFGFPPRRGWTSTCRLR